MKLEDAQAIDLKDWTLSGGGIQGESYFHKTDPTVLLKLFTKIINPDAILEEINLYEAIRNAGVSCPAPGKLVFTDGRYGIIYQRIPNKKSFCRAAGEDASLVEPLAKRLASLGLDLHSKSSEGTTFKSIVSYYDGLLKKNTTISPELRARMEKILENLRKEDKKTLLHGDFHFGNVITDGKNDYFIDLGTFSYGNPDWDNAMFYYICNMAPEFMLGIEYHITRSEAVRFWNIYKDAYYGADCLDDETLKQRYLPYILIRTLFFEESRGAEKILDDIRDGLISEMKS